MLDKYQYIDTHAHLNLSAFAKDREAVIDECAKREVAVINVGTKAKTSQLAVELATAHPHLYAIVGLHPIQTISARHDEKELGPEAKPFTSLGEEFDPAVYRPLAENKKVVGIGECGFDYYHAPSTETYDIQAAAFIAQIELANELNLPLMIHTRNGADSTVGSPNAYDDVYRLLKQYAKVPGNIHFYSGTLEQAKKFFDLGFTISFTGVITFTDDYSEIVKQSPLELIHAETDCPFVSPKPHRGKRCEPWMVSQVAKQIATIKGQDETTVKEQLLKNAKRLYQL